MRGLHRTGMRGLCAVTIATGLFAAQSQAAPFTYSEITSTTTQWSAGTSWDFVPVSAPDTQIIFGAGAIPDDDAAIVSNNDILGNFQLNRLDFTYAASAAGAAPTVTVTGNPLEFTGAGAEIYYNATGSPDSRRPRLIIDNNLVLSSDLRVLNRQGGSPQVTLNGAITGTGGLTFEGVNGQSTTFSLTNLGNDYLGDTTLRYSSTSGRSQILNLGAANVIPSGAGRGNLVVSAPGEAGSVFVDLNGFNQTVNGLASSLPGNQSASVQTVRSNGSAATLTIGDGDASATFTGLLTNGSGGLSLVKMGTGTQTLNGLSNYTGTTTITGGTLKIDYTQFGTSSTTNPVDYFSSASAMTMAGGTTFAIEGRGDGGAILVEGVGLNRFSRDLTFPNAIADELIVGQELIFTKTDEGVGVPATDVYVVLITDNGNGTSRVRINKRLASGSANPTADITSSVSPGSTSQTLASLTLSGGVGEIATLDFGSSDSVILLIDAAPVQLNDGSILNIVNWNGNINGGNGDERLLFTGSPGDFSSVFSQSEVNFDGYGPGYVLADFNGQYEVLPVPEPATLAVLGLAGLVMLGRRRQSAD